MHKLPTRCVTGHWEVLVPFSTGDTWIRCESMQDAHEMAQSGNQAFDALERIRVDEEVAQGLDSAARLFFKYNCHERAIWLAEHAKVARGEPSIFDPPS